MSSIAAHAAASPFGEDDVSLLVSNQLSACSGNIRQDRIADHVGLAISAVNSHGFSVGIEVESSGSVQAGMVIGLHEGLVEHFGPHGRGDLGEGS